MIHYASQINVTTLTTEVETWFFTVLVIILTSKLFLGLRIRLIDASLIDRTQMKISPIQSGIIQNSIWRFCVKTDISFLTACHMHFYRKWLHRLKWNLVNILDSIKSLRGFLSLCGADAHTSSHINLIVSNWRAFDDISGYIFSQTVDSYYCYW